MYPAPSESELSYSRSPTPTFDNVVVAGLLLSAVVSVGVAVRAKKTSARVLASVTGAALAHAALRASGSSPGKESAKIAVWATAGAFSAYTLWESFDESQALELATVPGTAAVRAVTPDREHVSFVPYTNAESPAVGPGSPAPHLAAAPPPPATAPPPTPSKQSAPAPPRQTATPLQSLFRARPPLTPVTEGKKELKRPQKVQAPAEKNTRSGIQIEGNRISVVDWTAWMRTAPRLLEKALQVGNDSPDSALAGVFRQVLPRYPWPPPPESALYPQWKALVPVMARALGIEPDPYERPRLHLVE